jgi:hypothetical protein
MKSLRNERGETDDQVSRFLICAALAAIAVANIVNSVHQAETEAAQYNAHESANPKSDSPADTHRPARPEHDCTAIAARRIIGTTSEFEIGADFNFATTYDRLDTHVTYVIDEGKIVKPAKNEDKTVVIDLANLPDTDMHTVDVYDDPSIGPSDLMCSYSIRVLER